MDKPFDIHLKDLITLKNRKIVIGGNKKIISTSIFIPENPSINCKTFFYFIDLIKSVETFNDIKLKGWIYRIYVDNMFFSAISKKDLETVVEAGDKFGTKELNQLISDIDSEIKLKAINGEEVTIKKVNGIVYINEAEVVTADIEVSNGIIHFINRVLQPLN